MTNLSKTIDSLGLEYRLVGELPAEITGISVDSRQTKLGHLFAAMPGSNVHGAEFVKFAVRMGASAVLTDAAGYEITQTEGGYDVPFLISDDPRKALSKAAAAWFGEQPETMVAITGTNGKTSVANFTRQIWEELGLAAVNFGTVGVEGAVSAPLSHTTPEPLTLHALLADLAAQGVTHAAMEASSHGLEQRRLDGVRLTAAGFTNLSRDHLDYHDGFEDYFNAKAGLFRRVLPDGATAVINIDDERGAGLAQELDKVLTVGHGDADICIKNTRYRADGLDVLVSYGGANHMVPLDLIGGFQADNVMLAAGLVIACGADASRVFEVLPKLQTVRGRMELVATRGNGAMVFVDFAHTPDALETALQAMRPHVMGRLLVVFGAGGDRDQGKRPLMGEAAVKYADVVYVTDDNPRTESPTEIRAAIMAACPNANEIGDRATAILTAIDALQPGDALLIAGKGHETGQIVGTDVLEFNDAEQASIAVAALEEISR
ncbi:MAG: UDP-N-acetylmuramoyl-L-alanyl-D-glutamate--2,6-diaminopimelate ligase [Rhodobacteraceae bacterium]|nr:MAG: UDP-N-acetylmuramoyl-L-alanyl-D-glutamate--2,6-diaminopimelate ligase [Paracoccaceae bacterium]